MEQKKSNMKPAIIFFLMVIGCLAFGVVGGYIELTSFNNDIPVPDASIKSIDYQTN